MNTVLDRVDRMAGPILGRLPIGTRLLPEMAAARRTGARRPASPSGRPLTMGPVICARRPRRTCRAIVPPIADPRPSSIGRCRTSPETACARSAMAREAI